MFAIDFDLPSLTYFKSFTANRTVGVIGSNKAGVLNANRFCMLASLSKVTKDDISLPKSRR